MEQKILLAKYDTRLWTRDRAREIRPDLEQLLEASNPGDTVVIDMAGVEVFDYSFANEFFGKSLINLPKLSPGCFLIVENLNDYTRENLSNALRSLNLVMIERSNSGLALVGKTHPTDVLTFSTIVEAGVPISASLLKDKLGINLTAVNERLIKLINSGLARREKTVSAVNREQYQYSVLK